MVILDTKTSEVLGFDIWGPNAPGPFAGGRMGSDRMVAVVMTVEESSFVKAVEAIVGSITGKHAHPSWLPVVRSLKKGGKI